MGRPTRAARLTVLRLSWPGYGDIIVPGFIVAYCAAMDKIHQIAHHAYLVTAATGNSRLAGHGRVSAVTFLTAQSL